MTTKGSLLIDKVISNQNSNQNSNTNKLSSLCQRRDLIVGVSSTAFSFVLSQSTAAEASTGATNKVKNEKKKRSDLGEIGLGCWSWGNEFVWQYDETMDYELSRVFDLAVDSGIKLFDTADSYGADGKSERLLGKFCREYYDDANDNDEKKKKKSRIDDIILATKFAPYPWRITSDSFVKAAKESANRFGRESIELGQLHWSTENYQPLQERALWDGIARAYEEGIIENVGLSNYGPRQLQKIHKYMSNRGIPIATLQVQYSLLSRFPELNGTKETCDELGIKLIAYSPLALGLLTGKYSVEKPPPGLRGQAYKGVLKPLPILLETMKEVAAVHNKTLPQVALNYCISKGTVPIPGAKNTKQLKDNLGAVGWRLSNSEIIELDKAAEKVGVSVSQNIFQTA